MRFTKFELQQELIRREAIRIDEEKEQLKIMSTEEIVRELEKIAESKT